MLIYFFAVFIALGVLVFYLIKNTYEYFYLYLYLLFTHVWMIMSSLYIECNDIFLIQTNVQGNFTGATIRLLILDIVFFVTVAWGFRYFSKKKSTRVEIYNLVDDETSGNNADWWIRIITVLMLYNFLDVLISGNIFTNASINKGNYYALYSKLPFTYYIEQLVVCFMYIMGMIFWEAVKSKNKKMAIRALLPLIIAFVYRYMRGLTFTTNFVAFIAFAIPYLMHLKIRRIKIKKSFIVAGVLVMGLLIGLKTLDFANNTNAYKGIAGTETAIGKLVYRGLALQGEVWWAIDSIDSERKNVDYEQLETEFAALFSTDEMYAAGIYHLMSELGKGFSRDGSDNLTLNCGYPAILISIFGYRLFILIPLIILGGLLYAGMCIYVYKMTMNKRYAHALFSYGILNELNVAFIMGGLFYFFTTKVIMCVVGLILLKIIFHDNRINVVFGKVK